MPWSIRIASLWRIAMVLATMIALTWIVGHDDFAGQAPFISQETISERYTDSSVALFKKA